MKTTRYDPLAADESAHYGPHGHADRVKDHEVDELVAKIRADLYRRRAPRRRMRTYRRQVGDTTVTLISDQPRPIAYLRFGLMVVKAKLGR